MNNAVLEVIARHKKGEQIGLYSICSSNPYVLRASMAQARHDHSILLVESTCNQVDQFGGYSGMNPSQFVEYAHRIADEMQFSRGNLILGGDHLGPSGWQDRDSHEAMNLGRALVRDYVAAGYQKIHLDASMRCADDPAVLSESTVASRAAELCVVAEQAAAFARSQPIYVIGTEVPIPGGAQESLEGLQVTSVEAAQATIECTRKAFSSKGLQEAWDRVVAVVVQPGVEFGNDTIIDYNPREAEALARFIQQYEQLVFEAHSTDYQTCEGLTALVGDHFALLKVGPALTFAFREAIFSLAAMEEELLPLHSELEPSRVPLTLEQAMLANPKHWQRHYPGEAVHQAFARRYSYSDRSRYYWPKGTVRLALQRLMENLELSGIPLSLLSRYMPCQYNAVRRGEISAHPEALVRHKIREVTSKYAVACGLGRW